MLTVEDIDLNVPQLLDAVRVLSSEDGHTTRADVGAFLDRVLTSTDKVILRALVNAGQLVEYEYDGQTVIAPVIMDYEGIE